MTGHKSIPFRRWIAKIIGVITVAGTALYSIELSIEQREYFLDRRGVLVEFEASPGELRDDGTTLTDIRLVSSGNLRVRLRTLLPVDAPSGKTPVVLLIGGHRTGSHAVDLIGDPQGIAYAAIDYPYDGNQSLSGVFEIARTVPDIQTAFLDTPPALMLAMDWLSEQPWFDPQRAEIAGVSLGVPFAAVAGALDKRFTRVWLIHGAVENYEWVMHAARDRIRSRILRSMAVRSTLFLAYGNSFRTQAWLHEIAPRPTVLIAATNDDRVPPSSLDAIVEASKDEHVRLVWTDGRHVGPDRNHELRQLIAIVADEINPAGRTDSSAPDDPG